MRLFGTITGGIGRHDRAEWLSPPFDLSWVAVVAGISGIRMLAGDVFAAGLQRGQVSAAGAAAADVFGAGGVRMDVYAAGSSAAEVFSPGLTRGDN